MQNLLAPAQDVPLAEAVPGIGHHPRDRRLHGLALVRYQQAGVAAAAAHCCDPCVEQPEVGRLGLLQEQAAPERDPLQVVVQAPERRHRRHVPGLPVRGVQRHGVAGAAVRRPRHGVGPEHAGDAVAAVHLHRVEETRALRLPLPEVL
uniref:Uncharacterized protein n=1 Tax=Arundo donax TaxID=35708 RepID=A0A0A9GXC7_ARUDO